MIMEQDHVYTSTCHLLIEDVGHLWPPTEENVKLERMTQVTLSPLEAKRYGAALVDHGPIDAAPTHDKQVTGTRRK
jgi:hypothetical protein